MSNEWREERPVLRAPHESTHLDRVKDKLDPRMVAGAFETIERLAKDKISHDIKGEELH